MCHPNNRIQREKMLGSIQQETGQGKPRRRPLTSEEFIDEVRRVGTRAGVAGGLLLTMVQLQSSDCNPSLNHAIPLVAALLPKWKQPEGPYWSKDCHIRQHPHSRGKVLRAFNEFRSVAHLWAALLRSQQHNRQDIWPGSLDTLATFLARAEAILDLACHLPSLGRVRFVEAQVAIAIDILLAIPLRPQNLSCLNWQHHFSEPNGPRGQLLLHIAARDTKTKRQEIVSEVPDDVARHLRWYRRYVLSRLGADVYGYLFVTEEGSKKSQATLTQQITEAIARHIGVHMTPHQFRHFGATSYLEDHPEDFETARAILGHAWGKTTRIYAGSSTRRASRAYNQFLFKQREELKLKLPAKKRGR